MNPRGIILHHSLTADGSTVSWSAIRDYHMNVQKWKDIGYHYGIERVGLHYEVLKGRMDNEQGAHCQGFNDWLGVCLVGAFDTLVPPEEQLERARRLCRSLLQLNKWGPERVLGHCETFALRKLPMEKSCPGLLFDMNAFRRSL